MGKLGNKLQGNDFEINSHPSNNKVLVEQLKAAIINENFPKELSKKSEGCLEFAVRSGELGINYITNERDLRPETINLGDAPQSEQKGLSRSGLKTLLSLLEAVLMQEDVISHATIFVYYSVQKDGNWAHGKMNIRRGIHHARF